MKWHFIADGLFWLGLYLIYIGSEYTGIISFLIGAYLVFSFLSAGILALAARGMKKILDGGIDTTNSEIQAALVSLSETAAERHQKHPIYDMYCVYSGFIEATALVFIGWFWMPVIYIFAVYLGHSSLTNIAYIVEEYKVKS